MADTLCVNVLLNPPIFGVLEAIPDVYGEGHLLLQNRPALIRIFNVSTIRGGFISFTCKTI